jgi:TonB family protein
LRNAAIVVCTLLALAWNPSRASALPGQEAGGEAKAASPRPNPDASGKYHVGDGVTPPKLVSSVDPEFTEQARRKKLEGVVVVALTVDTAGNPQDVRVARSLAQDVGKKYKQIALGLDANAVAAVKQYRFQPGQFQGKPVPVEIEVRVNFRIW